MKSYQLFILLFGFSISVQAQLETSNWFIQNNRVKIDASGISAVTPTGITPSFNPDLGSTSVADPNGNLLFACDGKKVIDKDLNIMPASNSISLGANNKTLLTAAFPGNANKHYLFYSYSQGSSWVLKYAVVDMTLNGGLGDLSSINNPVDSSLSAGFTLAIIPNSQEFWIVTHHIETDSFFSRKVTAAGIGTPVTSRAGTNTALIEYRFDDLKTSPDGKMIGGYCYKNYTVIFAYTISFAEVFNFNPATGILTNKVKTTRFPGYFLTENSVEFSPDSRLFYTCNSVSVSGLQPCGFGSSSVYQYNLCYTDSSVFTKYSLRSAYNFAFCTLQNWGRLQAGSDKKLRMPYRGGSWESVIPYPNRIGLSAGYILNDFTLPQGTGTVNPTFNNYYIAKAVRNNIIYQGGCYPAPVSFSVTNDTIGSFAWNFNDPASGSNNTSTLPAPQHQFSAPGIYTVGVQLYSGSGQPLELLSEKIEIKDPNIRILHNLPHDTVICSNTPYSIPIRLNVINGIHFWRKLYTNGVLVDDGVKDSFNITSPGTYYVEMRQNDCNGCIMTDSIRVSEISQAVADLGPDVTLCGADSVLLGGPDLGVQYLWNTGATTSTLWVTQPGQYWLRISSGNNCVASDTINISRAPDVSFSLPPDTTLCTSQTLLLQPAVPNVSYLWQNGSTSPTFLVNLPGTYWVRVTSPQGCRYTDTIHVSYITTTGVNLGADTTICFGQNLNLSTSITNAQYLWSTGATSSSILVSTPGSYWLQVDNGTCRVSDTIQVTYRPATLFSLGNDTAICNNTSLNLNPGIANANYHWQNGSTQPLFTVNSAGQYWVQVTDPFNCIYSDTINISIKPLPAVSLGADTTICQFSALTLNASGAGIQNWLWQDNTTQPQYTVQQAGTYFVSVTGLNGCKNSDTILVNFQNLPVFSLGPDTTICENRQLAFSFNLNNATYLWNTGSLSGNYSLVQPGLYWLDVKQGNCVRRDSIILQFKPFPTVNLGRDTTLCESQSYNLNVTTPGAVYLWQNQSVNPVYQVTQSGIFYVSVDLNGCINSDTVRVDYALKPVFSLGNDTVLCPGSTIILRPGLGNVRYLWQDGSILPAYTVTTPGLYYVTISNQCGAKTDSILAEKALCQLLMPNAFTPNNDGLNDVFKVKYPYFIQTFSMSIYNRFGIRVFYTTNPAMGWDGKLNGIEQNTDNYVWIIRLKDRDGKEGVYSGNLILIR